jgi:hypothetical protein
MVAEYRRLFGGRVGLPSAYTVPLYDTVSRLRKELQMVDRPARFITPPPRAAQLALPLAS